MSGCARACQHDGMSSILAAVSSSKDAEVMNKAAALAERMGARVDVIDTRSLAAGDVLRRVESLRPELIVKTPSGAAGPRRFTAHDADWEFALQCPAPVLLVRGRAWGDPLKFAAPVDLSTDEEEALVPGILRVTGNLVMNTHGDFDVLYSEPELTEEPLRTRRAVRLAQFVRQGQAGGGRLQMFSGDPLARLPALVAERRYDVIALGGAAHGEDFVERMPPRLARVLQATDSDVLLIGTPLVAPYLAPGSGLQQRPHEAQQLA